jgi:hypothetical protein
MMSLYSDGSLVYHSRPGRVCEQAHTRRPILTAEDVVRRIATECTYVDERGGVLGNWRGFLEETLVLPNKGKCMIGERDQSASRFGESEQLTLHQLRLLEWLDSRTVRPTEDTAVAPATATTAGVPEKWHLARDVQLYEWQADCIERWFAAGRRGTVKVVTGGGKTLLALALAERLQNQQVSDVRVAIVVPTIVLMHQWYDELLAHSDLPAIAIGRLGGGYKDDFSAGRRILIAVLASAHKTTAAPCPQGEDRKAAPPHGR